MEKLTIKRLGQEKTINFTNKKTGQPDSFKKIGFQTQEQGDRWYDFAFRTQHGLEVGKSYDFQVTTREYNGKNYYDAQFPKKQDMALSEVAGLKMTVSKLNFKVEELEICIKALAYKAGLQVKDLRAIAEEADRGYAYPVNDMPEPDFGDDLPPDMKPSDF
jgi:phage FluMu protein gp41